MVTDEAQKPMKIFLSGQVDSEQISSTAVVLTSLPSETERDLLGYRAITDRQLQQERALSMLHKLENFSRIFTEEIDSSDPLTRRLGQAIVNSDYQELAKIGIDLEYVWLDDILTALITGAPFVEIETVGPYAVHHLNEAHQLMVSINNLPNDEKAGILLCSLFRNMTANCDNIRMVALLDDINSIFGREFTKEEQNNYVVAIGKVFYDAGALLPDDIPGKDYVMLRESERSQHVEALIQRLEQSDEGFIERSHDDIVFRPSESFIQKMALRSESRKREFRRTGIVLVKNGIPTCQAIDAASFLNPINKHIVHLVILDKTFTSEQDKAYALIRALGIVAQERYHNIFFDGKKLPAVLVAYAISQLLQEEIRRFLRISLMFQERRDFGSDEYGRGNCSNKILEKDKKIISFVVEQLEQRGIPLQSAKRAVDVGAGSNLYPAMLLAPHVSEDGVIELIENDSASRAYLCRVIEQQNQELTWHEFEELMMAYGGAKYAKSFTKVCRQAYVKEGSIFSLPENAYDIAASYFVSESITVSRTEFRLAIRSLASSIKSGGMLNVAHILSNGDRYYEREIQFPTVKLSIKDIEEAYRDADLSFTIHRFEDEAFDKEQRDYGGMAVVLAQRIR